MPDVARIRAVIRLELQVQRREPLTALYILVFLLLAMAFAASGPVELVRGRGAVPRDAAWSLMLASTAITAFGQVITTMVAATVVLRDRADRVADLLVATRLTDTEYRIGKLLAALLILVMIYAAIPVGLVAGAVVGGGGVIHAMRGALPPFFVVVLPTMLAIGALQFAAGVLSGRLWVIVGQGLLLIWAWTAAIDDAAASTGALSSLFDPFGSAPLLSATGGWSDVQRATLPMPLTIILVASRALWLAIGATAATFAIWHRPSARPIQPAAPAHGQRGAAPIAQAAGLTRAGTPRWWVGAAATARYVSQWMLRDAGWRVLALLGALNVGMHAARDVGASPSATALLGVVTLHARLFLILLATIYAGELVWREREDRSAPLFDALPLPRTARIGGQVAGVVAAQVVLVAILTVAALTGAAVATHALVAGLPGLMLSRVLLPFVSWMLLSLAVHVLVQQKVVAHLLCIAGWAVGSVWFGAASPVAEGRVPPGAWLLVCLLTLLVVFWRWREGGEGRRHVRRSLLSRPLR